MHDVIDKQTEMLAMTSRRFLSFEELLRRVPEERRYLLDRKVENNRHLAKIAQKLIEWREVLPYLMESDAEEVEEAIVEDFRKTRRRRLVHSRLVKDFILILVTSDIIMGS